ncbi:hypothetical protein [Croceicoccus naphthovorans]|uniref:Uncharacterized protein n=2 Tax=Croceicoccus naphthovorans TaxID=1348774 RepID=A0A0G3XLW5_9SPHN|nr:hypothetical protein [Croceicoccus naphthovorans]AKM11616.1 hypothetical protein AB433_07015 [Croceicoccus naphthovorans]MBB3990658.1 ElaB/YqjD/DUF883 family membrane-anchored ribosome-binding protein [Croceicoccus naphthovorans]
MAEPIEPTTPVEPVSTNRAEAKGHFSKALDEAKAGAAALKAEAMEKAGAFKADAKVKGDTYKGRAGEKGDQLKADFNAYSEQAKSKAAELAVETKGKTSEAMVSLGRFATDNATTLDEKLGVKYGDYARSAAASLERNAAKLDAKSLDELGEDAREMVRKSPGTAVAVAVGAGFLLARLFRSK